MTEFRAEPCGKPVGLAGHPCMRVPGHPGICLSGLAYEDYQKQLIKSENYFTARAKQRIPWLLIASIALFILTICAQISLDVYLFVR